MIPVFFCVLIRIRTAVICLHQGLELELKSSGNKATSSTSDNAIIIVPPPNFGKGVCHFGLKLISGDSIATPDRSSSDAPTD
jgi:hypothetical protein